MTSFTVNQEIYWDTSFPRLQEADRSLHRCHILCLVRQMLFEPSICKIEWDSSRSDSQLDSGSERGIGTEDRAEKPVASG